MSTSHKKTRVLTRLHLTSSAQGWKKKKETHAKMSTQAPAPTAPQQPLSEPNTIQIPEWDSNAVHTSKDGIATTSQPGAHHGGKAVLQEKFNAVLPRSRSYFGLKRRTFLTVVACAFLALLALIIGLAVGLTKHSKGWVRFNISKVALTDVLLVDRICHSRQTASSMKEILPTTVLV